jgi:hypothetical protein
VIDWVKVGDASVVLVRFAAFVVIIVELVEGLT